MLVGRLFPRGRAGLELQSGGLALVGADGMELQEPWAQECQHLGNRENLLLVFD